MCSTTFTGLGRAQARALGYPDLPIAVVPHPFGIRTRDEIREIARQCVDDIARLLSFVQMGDNPCAPQISPRPPGEGSGVRAERRQASSRRSVVCEPGPLDAPALPGASSSVARAALIEVSDDLEELNKFFLELRWSDGLPVISPTSERVANMLRHTQRAPDEVVAKIAPAFGAATVERIAINGVLAGCYPEYLPVLIAAAEAIAAPEFNLQGIQATTNPAAVFLIVNGPIARRLGVNSGNNCLGPGTWANATLGRAVRLIQQNIGGALPGDMDHSTHGQAAKYTLCCAENEEANPWEPLHVEGGFAPEQSTVTVVGALSTLNMNSHAKDAADLLRVIGDTMAYPVSSDYVYGGAPWLVLSPEHAHILQREGLSKAEVKRRLWEQSKLAASRLSAKDFARVQNGRRAELGEIGRDTMVPISTRPEHIGVIVAGGPGTHSVYVPVSGHSRSVTREIL